MHPQGLFYSPKNVHAISSQMRQKFKQIYAEPRASPCGQGHMTAQECLDSRILTTLTIDCLFLARLFSNFSIFLV